MARGRTGNVELNLFPFMSVLISVMGILMFFLIVIVSTRVLSLSPKAAEPEPPRPEPQRSYSAGGDEAEEALPAGAPRLPDKDFAAAVREIRRLTVLLAQRERDCTELVRACEQLREDVTMIENPIAMPTLPPGRGEGASLGAVEKVKVVPDPRGHAVTKRPVIVEVQADKFIVYPEKTEYPVTQLPQMHSPLRKFLDKVDHAKKGQYLLVLVQPSGVPTYEKLRKCLLNSYSEQIEKREPLGGGVVRVLTITKSRIDIGVEPFRRDWLYFSEDQANKK